MNEVIAMAMTQISLDHLIYMTEVGLKQLQSAHPSTKCFEKYLPEISPMCADISSFSWTVATRLYIISLCFAQHYSSPPSDAYAFPGVLATVSGTANFYGALTQVL